MVVESTLSDGFLSHDRDYGLTGYVDLKDQVASDVDLLRAAWRGAPGAGITGFAFAIAITAVFVPKIAATGVLAAPALAAGALVNGSAGISTADGAIQDESL